MKMPYLHMGQRQISTMTNDDTFTIYRKKVAESLASLPRVKGASNSANLLARPGGFEPPAF
jgi:topoisomerase IA-like protein